MGTQQLIETYNKLCDEVNILGGGHVINISGRWWLCANDEAGWLVRRLETTEVDAVLKYSALYK